MGAIHFSIFCLYIALFSCYNVGSSAFKNEGLVGSALAVAGTNPYQVAIMQRLTYTFDVIDGKKFICGGSLIDAQWVLTAAQCVTNPDLRIIFGVTNIRIFEEHHVSFDAYEDDIFIHPGYNATNLNNDIALIRLPTPVKFNEHIQPISIASDKGRHTSETVFLSGWGRISPFTPASDFLRQATLKIIPNEECQKGYLDPFFYLRCSHLCTENGLFFSEIGACAGDAGAPLITFNSERSRPEQIGVVSNPPFICKGTEPMIYTKVSEYESWIADVIDKYIPIDDSDITLPDKIERRY